MFFNFYLNSITADSPEGREWVRQHMAAKGPNASYDWNKINALPHGATLETHRGQETLIPIDGKNKPMPVAFINENVLNACFPGKDHDKLRLFLTMLRWGLGDTPVVEGVSSYNFMFDEASIAAITDFHETRSKRVVVFVQTHMRQK